MFLFETHIAVVIGVAITLMAAVMVLQQRRTPQSTAAWLMFILLAPYLAIPVFLALGFRKRGSGFVPIAFRDAGAEAEVPEEATGRTDLENLFIGYGMPPATGGNALRLCEDGQDCWREVLEIVGSATKTLDVTFYLIADDAVGRAFVEALTEKARAGVRVRLIIDRLGGFLRPARQLSALRAAGGEVRDFSPLVQRPNRGHLNLRNHRKMILADGMRVLSGGRNIGAEYLGPDAEGGRWSDLSFVLEGPAVQGFADVFRSDWATTGGKEAEPTVVGTARAGDSKVQLVPSGPDLKDDPLHDGLASAIYSARRRIWIVTPYFLPTEHLEHALSTAARGGVDVRILVPARSNQRIADLARGGYLRGLGAVGCTILRYEGGMIHAKACVIDDMACVGSANFDVRSMLLNFEMMLFLYGAADVAWVADWFGRFESRCRTGTVPSRLWRRLVEGVFRLGAPIL
ncbi:phospholipase D-like domain-containing protein [Oceaniglobus roseus]|uniref:phospholipase D-like domain-containing protein n=1 Tax=Oceaniglobus roseus TaxID=1737570 RepID=UPI000C7F5A67|nr:phospholipase D-like domain-containing protein [Kandeliimicrobium roseum]